MHINFLLLREYSTGIFISNACSCTLRAWKARIELPLRYTGSVKLTPHGKWREIDLQPSCWMQLALLGWCYVSLHFLWGVYFTDPVVHFKMIAVMRVSTTWPLSELFLEGFIFIIASVINPNALCPHHQVCQSMEEGVSMRSKSKGEKQYIAAAVT